MNTKKNTSRYNSVPWCCRYGCLPAATVSKNVSYVIAGDEAGSKLDKAKQLGQTLEQKVQLKAVDFVELLTSWRNFA